MTINSLIKKWQNFKNDDLILSKELKLKEEKIAHFFENPLKFNEDGICALMGAGTSKINAYTITGIAQAFAKYLIKQNKKTILIGHDDRHNSLLYSQIISEVMEKNNIKSYFFKNNTSQPLPLFSYAINRMKIGTGMFITASSKPKEYNGINFFNQKGELLDYEDIKIIKNFYLKIDAFQVKRKTWIERYISDQIIDDYSNEVFDSVKLKKIVSKNQRKLKVSLSTQHGSSGEILNKLLAKMDINFHFINKQMVNDPNFKHTKTPNPILGKSFLKLENDAWRTKVDLMFSINPVGSNFAIATKYKKRYKFLNANEHSALYLDYLIKQKNIKKTNDYYIIKTNAISDLAAKIAKKNNIKVYEVESDFINVSKFISQQEKKTNEKFLFAYDENYNYLIDPNITKNPDAIQGILGFIEMSNYYFQNQINIYNKLKELYEKYGSYFVNYLEKNISQKTQTKLIKAIMQLKKIGDHKIKDIIKTTKVDGNFNLKIIFKNKSWFLIKKSSSDDQKIKIYFSLIDKNNNFNNLILLNQQILDFIDNNSEEIKNITKFTWKTNLKYVFFILFFIGTLLVVFLKIYKNSASQSVFSMFDHILNTHNRFVWFSVISWVIFNFILTSWIKKRIFIHQKIKVNFRHILISNIMGSIISFITPLTIGGDAIVYWYLRKKGVERSSIISVISSNTILFQARLILQVLIFLISGWSIYIDIFNSNDIQSHAALIWYFIGLSWICFSSFMIFLITISKNTQEFILRNSILFLEWFKLTHIYNPQNKIAHFKYEFSKIRNSMKRIWFHPWFPIEIIFYFLIPIFLDPIAILISSSQYINKNLKLGSYFSQLVIKNIVNTANSLSLTPGGSGTGEWLSITTNKFLFSEYAKSHKINEITIISGWDLIWKVLYQWPTIIFSTILFFNVIFYEKKIYKYKNNQKNTHKVNIFISLFWILLFVLFIIWFFYGLNWIHNL